MLTDHVETMGAVRVVLRGEQPAIHMVRATWAFRDAAGIA